MTTRGRMTRRAVLASIGTGAVAGTTTSQDPAGDDGRDHDVDVRIEDCYTATVCSDDPNVRFLTAGIYFRETDRYSFHDEEIESFPHNLDLRTFDWARERDAVLLNVAVAHDIATETVASDTAPSRCQPE